MCAAMSYADLDASLEVEGNDVLCVEVVFQLGGTLRPFQLDTVDASAEGFEFDEDQITIHGKTSLRGS